MEDAVDLRQNVTCEKCKTLWTHSHASTWRAYLTDDDPPVIVLYCPGCADKEFGGA